MAVPQGDSALAATTTASAVALTDSMENEILAKLAQAQEQQEPQVGSGASTTAVQPPAPPSRKDVVRLMEGCRSLIFPECYPSPFPLPTNCSSNRSSKNSSTSGSSSSGGRSVVSQVATLLQELVMASLSLDHWERKTAHDLQVVSGFNPDSASPVSSAPTEEAAVPTSLNRKRWCSTTSLLVEGPPNIGHTAQYSSEFCPRHGIDAPLKRPLEIPVSTPHLFSAASCPQAGNPATAVSSSSSSQSEDAALRSEEEGEEEKEEEADHKQSVSNAKVLDRRYRTLVQDLIVVPFLSDKLPAAIIPKLQLDVAAFVEKDVATRSKIEVTLCYPGITALLHQRVAHQLHRLGVPLLLTRLITEVAHTLTGIDIHPATVIGDGMFIDHGTGIVIGATAEIGAGVALYQGVCLGARSFVRDRATGSRLKHLLRHPVVEDGVTLYSHATVLGRVTVGKRATIGGNVFIMDHVAPKEVVLQGKAHVSSVPLEEQCLSTSGSYKYSGGMGI